MFLVDQFTKHYHMHGPSNSSDIGPEHKNSIPMLGLRLKNTGDYSAMRAEHSASSSTSALVGLIIHCASDGIAMGAAFSSDKSHLQLLVFAAILLHKAPAAFALATFLLSSHTPRKSIRKHLVIFSMTSPLASIITYLLVSLISLEAKKMGKLMGLILLFSAGSFLYTSAVHILPEVIHNQNSRNFMNRNIKSTVIVAVVTGKFSYPIFHPVKEV